MSVDPILAITAAVTFVKGALDLSKSALELLKSEKPDVLALRDSINQLRKTLVAAESSLIDVQSENNGLRLQIGSLQQEIGALTSEKPTLEHSAYWFQGDGPFCTNCWDDNRKKIRLKVLTGYELANGNCQCPKCGTAVRIDSKWLP